MRDQPTDAEMLVTLIGAACARQSLPPDVTRWAAKRLLGELTPRERERARNETLMRAAELIQGGPWGKATKLLDEVQLIAAEWTLHTHHPPPAGTLEAHLVTALTLGEVPTSIKQMWRIIIND